MESDKSTHFETMLPHQIPNIFVGDLKVIVNKYQPDDVVMVSPKGYENMLLSLVRGKTTDIAIEFEKSEIMATKILEIINTSQTPLPDIQTYLLHNYPLFADEKKI